MRKIISVKGIQHLSSFYFFLLVFFISSCSEQEQVASLAKRDKSVFAPPITHLLDTMPPPQRTELRNVPSPRVVVVPKKQGSYYIMHTESGEEKIQLSPPVTTNAPPPAAYFTNYTDEDGLAMSNVWTSFIDRKGQLWFGFGGGGVSRFDGTSFTNYTIDHGLTNNGVYSIAEDKNGHLWFATAFGVSRFDGVSFTTYTTEDGLCDNGVLSIVADRKGNIWFGTGVGGVSRYDGVKFTTIDTSDGLPFNNVNRILEDSKGNIWFATFGGGISRFDGKEFKNFNAGNGLPTNFILTIFEDSKGIFWIGTYDKGFYQFDGTAFKKIETDQKEKTQMVHNICEDRKGNIWISTYGNGVFVYDGKDFHSITTEQGLINNSVQSITPDHWGNLWIATDGGISCFKGNYIRTYPEGKGLSDFMVNDITQDKYGNLWFGTFSSGVVRFDGKQFTKYTTNQGLSTNLVFKVTEDKSGNLWFGGMENGVSSFDGTSITNYTTLQGLISNRIKAITCDRNGNLWFAGLPGGLSSFDGKWFINYTHKQGIINEFALCILADSKGIIWTGTEGGGVNRFDGKYITLFTVKQGLGSDHVMAITEDSSGNIWFGTSNGLSRYDGIDIYTLNSSNGLSNNYVTDITEDREGALWIGTNKGLSKLSFDTGKNGRKASSLIGAGLIKEQNDYLRDLVPVWEIYSVETGFPMKDLLPGSLLIPERAMTFGNNNDTGVIWAAFGDTKVVSIDPKSVPVHSKAPIVNLKVIRIDESNVNWYGLGASNYDSTLISRQEHKVFGKMLTNSVRDSLHKKFSDIRFDSITPFDPIPQKLVLPYRHNRVSFDYGAIETNRPFMIRYQYMLEGYDTEWNPVTEKTTASYGNISEGSYTFKLKAMSPEGIWSEPIAYSFRVLPPWYRSWWAYTGYGICLLAGIFYFDRIQRNRIREKERAAVKERELLQAREIEKAYHQLKETQAQLIQSEKMASLGELTAGIAHEIQNPLNFVNNFSEVSKELIVEMKDEIEKMGNTDLKNMASDIENNLDKINHHGKRADAIVRGMLQHSRTSTGVKEPTDINALADEYLRLAYQGLRAKDKDFNTILKTDFDKGIDLVKIIPQDIGRVLLNLYNNAFYAVAEKQKLSTEGYQPTVSVRTKKKNGEVEISVTDNGNGIPEKVLDKVFQPFFTTKPTGQGTGLGLSLSYDIIKAHQGKINIRNSPGMGVEFIISLPIDA